MDTLSDPELELHEAERAIRRVAETVGRASPELRRAEAEAVRALRLYRWRLAMARRVGAELAAA